MTPKDYLENSLAAVQGDTEEVWEKNKVNSRIEEEEGRNNFYVD